MIGTTLYVADEVDNCIRSYDTGSGSYLGPIADPQGLVLSPTHLLVNGGELYIGVSPKDANAGALVLCFNPSAQNLSTVVSNPETEGISVTHPSGMTFDGSGNFYLADLDGEVVYQFSSDFSLTPNQPFLPQGGGTMPDQPEFILWVDDAWLSAEVQQ